MPKPRYLTVAAAALLTAALLSPTQLRAAAAGPQVAGSALGDTTVSDNNLRTGWDQDEPQLSPDAVTAANFGPLFTSQVQGQVYAQPLVVNRTASSPGTLVIATEDDNVYGLDPTDGRILWTTSVGRPWSASVVNCGDLTPNIGVTSTPVYDPSTDTIYVMAKSAPDGPDSEDPQWYLHALDAETGVERVQAGWPVPIGGHPDNDPKRTFNEKTAAQRPGLLLLNGVVYAGFASYCDHKPYDGYVVGVNTATATQTAMFSMEVGTAEGEAGVWQAGGGLVSDGDGQIIVTTGNGDVAPTGPTLAPPNALNEAVVRLTVQSDGTLKATDWFSPSNGATLNQSDSDFGSGGPLAIPDGYAPASHPHLLVQVGKDGRVFLLDRDDLGGFEEGPGNTDKVLGVTELAHGVWGHLAFWGDGPATGAASGLVYLVENGGNLRALRLSEDGDGNPELVATANSQATFGYTSGSPMVTSDGTTAGTALVWVVGVDDATGSDPVLHAYNAEPDNGVLDEVYSAPLNPPGVTDGSQAHGVKFTKVATDNGRVFVATRDGVVFGFGHPSSAPIDAPRTDVGSVPVGGHSADVPVTLTATRAITVTGVSTSAPYTVPDPPTFPVVLAANQTMTVNVRLSPTAAGDQPGTLTVATKEGTTPGTVLFGLAGYGTQPGLISYPSGIDFGTVPLPGHSTQGVNIVNTSGADETIGPGSPALSPPFSSPDLPTLGQVIPAGASLAIPLTYHPTAVSASDTATLSIPVNNGAQTLAVNLTGSAVVGAAKLVLSPTSLDFGLVPKGTSVTKTFEIQNQGNILLTINKAKAPFGAFTTDTPVSEGQQITPDQSVIQSVTFTPTASGTATAKYQITGNDGSGIHREKLIGTDDQLTDRYNRQTWLQALLGAPVGRTHALGTGYDRRFTHGRMFWSGLTGVREMHGPILHRYQHLGGALGPAGFPVSDVQDVWPGGARSTFGHGWEIYWSRRTGAWSVHGRLGRQWQAYGAQHSSLGYPAGEQVAIKGGVRQRFQHGVLSWTHHNGYRIHLTTG